MDNTWGNTPNSPNYIPTDDEILELYFDIDPREYYAEQYKCICAHAFEMKKTA